MADLYSVIPGIQPDQQDIIEAELLAKQILEANFPDLDLREGTGLRDLVLRPAAFLLALCKKGSDSFFVQNTLSGATDDTPAEVIDDLMGNLFLTRKTGTYAVINARVYFARSKTISLTQDTSFSTDGAILFFPAENITYPAASLQYDSYQNEWYVDVDLKAADTGTQYNLSEGSLLYFSNFDPYFLHAEINYLKESSSEAETNSEFIDRASTAISTRNLINSPSIVANLSANFNTLSNILPVGSGDIEMYRDFVKVQLDPLAAKSATAISCVGVTVTVTVPSHGFLTGQTVVVSGAAPSGYNGSYTITRLGNDTFTYTVPIALSTATSLPQVQGVDVDMYIHQGGTVDIYCDKDLVVEIEQHTLDSTGSTTISGPVVKIERSPVSAGVDADTVPLAPVVAYTSQDVTDLTRFYATTSGLATGDVVAITGITQSVGITSLSCLPGDSHVTVSCSGHPISVNGSLITIQGVFPVEYNGDFVGFRVDANTFTYQIPTRIQLAGSGSSMVVLNRGMLEDAYPAGASFGTVTVSSTYFNVTMPNLWAGVPKTGTAVITHEPPFSITYPGYTSRSDATFVVNNSSPQLLNQLYMIGNPLSQGRYVSITGSSNSLNNQVWKVDSRVDENTVNLSSPTHNNYVAGTGPIIAKFVTPISDLGFSDKQELRISYGSTYAGDTVSLQTTSFLNVPNVQAYIENSDNRVLCGDFLARGFDIYLLDFALTVYNSATPTTGTAQVLIEEFLNSLSPGSVLVVSELVAKLKEGGITNLRTPISITSTFYQKDMFSFEPFFITDVFNPANNMAVYVLNTVTTSSMAI